jgi:hypothetical protein
VQREGSGTGRQCGGVRRAAWQCGTMETKHELHRGSATGYRLFALYMLTYIHIHIHIYIYGYTYVRVYMSGGGRSSRIRCVEKGEEKVGMQASKQGGM